MYLFFEKGGSILYLFSHFNQDGCWGALLNWLKTSPLCRTDAIVGWLWMGYKMMVSGASKDEGRILRCDGVKWGVATGWLQMATRRLRLDKCWKQAVHPRRKIPPNWNKLSKILFFCVTSVTKSKNVSKQILSPFGGASVNYNLLVMKTSLKTPSGDSTYRVVKKDHSLQV